MNILDSLKGLVTDELVNKAAGALGEDGGAISNVMQGAIPTVLSGLLGSDSKNHGDLAGLFGQAAGNDNLIGDIMGGLTSGDNANNGGGMVSSLLSGIFGDKVGGIVNILTNLGGIKSGSASSILSIVGPMIASYFGKKMLKDGLNFGSIMNLIGGSKDEIMAAAPAGVADAIGLKQGPWEMVSDLVGNITGKAGAAAGAVTGAAGAVVGGAGDAVKGAAGAVTGAAGSVVSGASDAVKGAAGAVTGAAGSVIGGAGDLASGAVGGAKKGMKWLWPLLLVGALAIGAFWLLGKAGCNNKATDMAGDVTNAVGGAAGDVVDGVGDAAGAVGDAVTGSLDEAGNWVAAKGEDKMIKLENGVELATTKGSVIDKLYNFSADEAAVPNKDLPANWFNFEDVQFETGSANLKASAADQIKNAAEILKAFPNVKIKIGGYTDNTGSEDGNQKLSENRAKAVYNAILAQGATAASFDDKAFEGYGSQYPVGDNATEEGKAQNRRIACVVTAK